MLKRARVVAIAAAGFLAASTVDRSSVALAASTCINTPNAQAARGAHWYYHVDPVNHRRCWYVDKPQISLPPEQPAATQSGPAPTEQPAAQSPFSSFISQLSKLASPSVQQSEPSGNSATAQPNPVATPTADDILPKHRVGRPDASKAAVVRKPDRAVAVTPPAPPRSASPITQEERDALFAQYLRWQDDREKRDELFQELLHNPTSPRAP